MFSRLISKILVIVGLAFGPAAIAKDDHAHAKGPHGGDVKSLGDKLHMEATRKGATVSLFVLDSEGEKEATAKAHGGGTVTVVSPGSKPQKVELKAGDDFSKQEVSVAASGKVTVLVTLKLDGKQQTAKFSFD